jgi:hypothetical protein
MKMKKTLYFLATALILTSCSSSMMHLSGDSVLPNSVGINIPEVQSKLIIDKSKVLTGTSETTVHFGFIKISDTSFIDAPMPGIKENEIKSAAVFNALAETGMDIIVNPKYVYTINKSMFTKITTCQVSGYGAKIEIQ